MDDGGHRRGCGLGRLWTAILSMVLTWLILAVVEKIERRISPPHSSRDDATETQGES